MKNVTVSLDDEVAQWVRVWAAKQNISGITFSQQFVAKQGYQVAIKQFFSRTPEALKAAGDKYPSRDDLYKR